MPLTTCTIQHGTYEELWGKWNKIMSIPAKMLQQRNSSSYVEKSQICKWVFCFVFMRKNSHCPSSWHAGKKACPELPVPAQSQLQGCQLNCLTCLPLNQNQLLKKYLWKRSIWVLYCNPRRMGMMFQFDCSWHRLRQICQSYRCLYLLSDSLFPVSCLFK